MSRRQVIAAGAGAAATLALPPLLTAQQRIVLNDASQLNPTPVIRHWIATQRDEAACIEHLRAELKEAAAVRRPVAVGAARHSMGGQSLPRNGTAITFDIATCVPDRAAHTYRVHAGTRWKQVIATLDSLGFSPAVMQSNHDFGVAATFSVNAHGWPVPYGPFGTTVRALRLMLADGTLVHCSREENAELFALAMGGYGLFGVILDLEVDMVENLLLKPTFEVMPSHAFAARFLRAIDDDRDVLMAYGRLSVARQSFFDEALLVTYRPHPTPLQGLPAASAGGLLSSVSREIYRAQIGSERAKRARWFAETVAGPKASAGIATRNTLMNEPVANLAGRDRWRTDILHEYFVPPEQFTAFIKGCQEIIPPTHLEFLNVTLRYVAADPTSVLAFAPTRRIAAVMSFSQEIVSTAEAEMLRTTEALIDRVIALGGTFYLPYRLHARPDQVWQAYPKVAQFIERKRHYDPGLLFRNAMWDAYFATSIPR
jgi:FAD/FMN-containing dehydrogenase